MEDSRGTQNHASDPSHARSLKDGVAAEASRE
jgi:hypothetical protein